MRESNYSVDLTLLLLPLGLVAQSNEELMKQIEALKQQLQALEAESVGPAAGGPRPRSRLSRSWTTA